MNRVCIGIMLLFMIISCNQQGVSEKDRQAIKEEMKQREFKKVNEAEIIAKAFEEGKEIAKVAQQALVTELATAIGRDGIGSAAKYCNVRAYPMVDSLSKMYDATIKRVSLKLRNPADAPDSLETNLLEAYQYNVDNGLEVEDNVQKKDDRYLLYTKPIVLRNPACLQCHGKIGQDIKPENYEVIQSLYPADSATGYALGDLRGMWSITLSKKNLVNAL